MKLGQAKAIRVLDDHDLCPRQVHADLDHRRRYQDIERSRAECFNHRTLALGRKLAV